MVDFNNGKKKIVFGIGGVSTSGKSTLARQLKQYLQCPAIGVDSYCLGPIITNDPKVGKFYNWEEPESWDLMNFKQVLLQKINENTQNKYVIAEGFLLYYLKDIADLIDVKIVVSISKDTCRIRRKASKDRKCFNEHIFQKYLWEGWNKRNIYFDLQNPHSYQLSGDDPKEIVFQKAKQIIDSYIH